MELLNVPAFYIKISGCFYKIIFCMTTRTLESSLCSTKHPVLCLSTLLYYQWGRKGGGDRLDGIVNGKGREGAGWEEKKDDDLLFIH